MDRIILIPFLIYDAHKIVAIGSLGIHFYGMVNLRVSATEKKLTYLIANRMSHRRLDGFMILVSNPYQWLLPALTIAMVLIYINWESGLTALLLGGLGAGIADSLNSRFIKRYTNRIRPGKQYADIRSLGTMNNGKKSFPSNHASNTMAFALSFGLVFPVAMWMLIPLSVLVGYSRIYCGAHFPLDVVAGWIHGAFWVFILFYIASLI